MAQIHYIKDLYENKDLSLREIARRTKHSFSTVQKYAYKEDWNKNNLPNIAPKDYPVLGEYIPEIDKWLEADRKLPRKQRHTAKRIYDRLREEESFTGSYSSVKRYIRKKRFVIRNEHSGYLPIEHPAGCGQVDFGKFIYYDRQAAEQNGYALTISFPYSNKGYTQVFPSENQECLLEGMKRIFEHIGGVPPRLRFDNMSTAVAQILRDGERTLTDGFNRFMLHYRFQADFCNPASGNEKGNVENKVGYSRRNFLVPVPTITSFEAFNEELFGKCEEDGNRPHYMKKTAINDLWQDDKAQLLVLPAYPYEVYRYTAVVVNKNGFVTIDTNHYGLSPTLHGETVQAKVFSAHIEFYHDHKLVARFPRSYGTQQEIYDWTQYLTTLIRKPGAVEHTRFFRYIPRQWQSLLENSHGKERKSALLLLKEIVTDGNAPLCEDALQLAMENGRTDADSVRQCYYLIARKEYRPDPLVMRNSPVMNYNPNLTAYDSLMGGEGHA